MSFAGMATVEATKERVGNLNHCLDATGLSLSGLGIGTYGLSGGKDGEDVLLHVLEAGCNVIDTAPNYGDGLTERKVGNILSRFFKSGGKRANLFIATKAGLAPQNEILPANMAVGPEHSCFEPEYLRHSVEKSRQRLGLDTLDCVFLHNIELLLLANPAKFHINYARAAQCMKNMAASGQIRAWGISSWNGFRTPPDHPEYISLEFLLAQPSSRLKYLQMPIGVWAPEAICGPWQNGKSIVDLADGLSIFANSTLMNGNLARGLALSQEMIEHSIRFAEGLPNVACTLLGISSKKHMDMFFKILRARVEESMQKKMSRFLKFTSSAAPGFVHEA